MEDGLDETLTLKPTEALIIRMRCAFNAEDVDRAGFRPVMSSEKTRVLKKQCVIPGFDKLS